MIELNPETDKWELRDSYGFGFTSGSTTLEALITAAENAMEEEG